MSNDIYASTECLVRTAQLRLLGVVFAFAPFLRSRRTGKRIFFAVSRRGACRASAKQTADPDRDSTTSGTRFLIFGQSATTHVACGMWTE